MEVVRLELIPVNVNRHMPRRGVYNVVQHRTFTDDALMRLRQKTGSLLLRRICAELTDLDQSASWPGFRDANAAVQMGQGRGPATTAARTELNYTRADKYRKTSNTSRVSNSSRGHVSSL